MLKNLLAGAAMAATISSPAASEEITQENYPSLAESTIEIINNFKKTGEVGKDQANCAIAATFEQALVENKDASDILNDSTKASDVREACAERTGYDKVLRAMTPGVAI